MTAKTSGSFIDNLKDGGACAVAEWTDKTSNGGDSGHGQSDVGDSPPVIGPHSVTTAANFLQKSPSGERYNRRGAAWHRRYPLTRAL